MDATNANRSSSSHGPWNKGKLVGQKAPFKLKDIWAIRVRLQMDHRVRELALFNLGLYSKLRGCDLVALRVRDVCHGEAVANRAIVVQRKTGHPVQFEITPATREAVAAWIKLAGLRGDDNLFPSRVHTSPHIGTRQYARIPSRVHTSPHIGTRQYARIVHEWVDEIGLDGQAEEKPPRLQTAHEASAPPRASLAG
jgi:hypothetical protein